MGRSVENDPKVQRNVYPRRSLWERIEVAAKADGDRPLAQFTAILLAEAMDARDAKAAAK
jgi:hypothetical protein